MIFRFSLHSVSFSDWWRLGLVVQTGLILCDVEFLAKNIHNGDCFDLFLQEVLSTSLLNTSCKLSFFCFAHKQASIFISNQKMICTP